MNVTLNIENDADLRAYIKECIRGQVLSIVREEFVEMVQTELERKMKSTDTGNFEYMKKEAMRQAVSNILYKEHGVGNWNTDFIRPVIEAEVKKAIANKDWNRLVDDLAKEKVKSLLG